MSFKNMKKSLDVHNDLSHKHEKISNTLYFWLHKNDKRVDQSIYIFKSSNHIRFCYFSVASNTKNFTLKICMLVNYNIDYVQNLHWYFFDTQKYDF
jgi:hypothetical protein